MDQHVNDTHLTATPLSVRTTDLDLSVLLRDVSRISALLDVSVQSEWIVKKAQFLAYELPPFAATGLSVTARVEVLNRFLFETKRFRLANGAPAANDPTSFYLLHRVLSSHVGVPAIVALIYAWLAQNIGISLQFVDLHPTCFLKFVENGKSHFIDLAKNGEILDCDGLLDHINERYKSEDLRVSALLESVSQNVVMMEYLTGLRQAFIEREQAESLLIIQNALIECQPSNLTFLGERSVLHFKLGHFKNALADLKRYFAFNSREKAPSTLVKIYDDLLSLTKRHP